MIEQLGVRRRFARGPEVVHAAHESVTHEPAPHAIDDDASGKRILVAGNPVRYFQSPSLFVRHLWHSSMMDGSKKPARHGSPEIINAPANVNGRVFDAIGFLDGWNHGALRSRIFELLEFGFQLLYV